MEFPRLARLFGADAAVPPERDPVVLAEFDSPRGTPIDVTPQAAAPAHREQAANGELAEVVRELARGMVDAWDNAAGQMQRMLASDHVKLEAAAAEMMRVADQLRGVTGELTEMRRRVSALEASVESLAGSQAAMESRLTAQATALRELHATAASQRNSLQTVIEEIRGVANSRSPVGDPGKTVAQV